MGPKYVGYKGRLQFIADALKMFLKGCFVPSHVNEYFFIFWPACVLGVCLVIWINALWAPNLVYYPVEYTLLFLSFISIFLHVAIFFTGYFSKNKYAMLGANRTSVLFFGVELLFGLLFINVAVHTQSFNIAVMQKLQHGWPVGVIFALIVNLLIMLIMLEINKSPFDLSEAETELVTGFHTEYGAFFFALYYLGEYFHLFFTSVLFVYLISGF